MARNDSGSCVVFFLVIVLPIGIVIGFLSENVSATKVDDSGELYVVSRQPDNPGTATVYIRGTPNTHFSVHAENLADRGEGETLRGTTPARFGVEYGKARFFASDGVYVSLKRGYFASEDTRLVADIYDAYGEKVASKTLDPGRDYITMHEYIREPESE